MLTNWSIQCFHYNQYGLQETGRDGRFLSVLAKICAGVPWCLLCSGVFGMTSDWVAKRQETTCWTLAPESLWDPHHWPWPCMSLVIPKSHCPPEPELPLRGLCLHFMFLPRPERARGCRDIKEDNLWRPRAQILATELNISHRHICSSDNTNTVCPVHQGSSYTGTVNSEPVEHPKIFESCKRLYECYYVSSLS